MRDKTQQNSAWTEHALPLRQPRRNQVVYMTTRPAYWKATPQAQNSSAMTPESFSPSTTTSPMAALIGLLDAYLPAYTNRKEF